MKVASVSSSFFYRLVVLLFAFTLFADQSNIADPFVSTVVLHGDSDEDDSEGMLQGMNGGSLHVVLLCPGSSQHPENVRVALDQDSPSLAVDALPSARGARVFSSPGQQVPVSLLFSRLLYLHLCVLRI